jgi:hypothetical protein
MILLYPSEYLYMTEYVAINYQISPPLIAFYSILSCSNCLIVSS